MKRTLALTLVFVMIASLFAGCGGGEAGNGDTTGSAESSTTLGDGTGVISENATASGAKNGNVTMGPDSDLKTYVAVSSLSFETLDPFFVTGAVGYRMGFCLFDTLWDLEYGADSEVGVMVKDWTFSDDGYEIYATLHDDMYDWAGNHLTASDIVWSYNKYLEAKTLANVESMEQTGEYELTIRFAFQYYPGFLIVALGPLFPVSQAAYEADPDSFRENPIGTGPYQAIEFISGAKAVFQQTYNYWGDFERLPAHRQANVDVIAFDVITENSQVQTALETNTIQVGDISVSVAEDFTASGEVQVFQFPQAYSPSLMLNMYPGSIFADNLALREAIAYAIDMEAVSQAATRGTGKNNGTYGHAALSGYNTEWEHKYWEYNLDLAKEKMAEAGYPDGGLRLRFVGGASSQDFAVVLQACLAEIGIDMQIDALEETQYLLVRQQANTLEWDLCYIGNVGRGFIMTIFKMFNDVTQYEWGAMGGDYDEELHGLTMTALYDQSQENIDAVFEATIQKLNYIPMYEGYDFVGTHPKIEAPIRNASLETAAQASLFADDYDVYYEG